jgi:hypothetical protein
VTLGQCSRVATGLIRLLLVRRPARSSDDLPLRKHAELCGIRSFKLRSRLAALRGP